MSDSSPASVARWPLAGLPRLLRAAGRELLDHDRPAHQRGLRFHRHVDQRVADERPTHIAVAFDVSRQTFPETYADYKGNRAASPTEFAGQVDLIADVLDAMGIPSLRLPGYEADDIIATLSHQATAAGLEVLILSGTGMPCSW